MQEKDQMKKSKSEHTNREMKMKWSYHKPTKKINSKMKWSKKQYKDETVSKKINFKESKK